MIKTIYVKPRIKVLALKEDIMQGLQERSQTDIGVIDKDGKGDVYSKSFNFFDGDQSESRHDINWDEE